MTMRHNITHALALILVWGFCFVGTQARATGGVLLSVQEFEAVGVAPSLAASVTEMLRAELARSRRLRLLEETGRLYSMQRQSARFRDLVRESSLRRLGELLESRYVLTGSVSRLDSLYILNARVVDSESGEIRASEIIQHGRGVSEIGATVRRLARNVLTHFPLTGNVTAVFGDTLVTDVGLEDGILPGQEVTVAELAPEDPAAPVWARGLARSVRCRVLDAAERTSRLVPIVKPPGGPLVAGARVIRIEGGLPDGPTNGAGVSDRPLAGRTTGAVVIETQPSGALVILSGLDAGRTPVRMSDLSPGRHQVLIGLDGYKQMEDSVLVVPDVVSSYSFELERRTGRLTIITRQSDVTVRVDTLTFEVQGVGRITLKDFPEGTHRIRASRPGFEAWSEQVEVNFNRDSALVIDLKPHPGSLLVQSTPPGANIILDGVFTGKITPWSLSRLDVGKHVVSLVLPGYGAAQQTVSVEPGVDRSVELELRQGWFGFEPVGMVLVPAGELLIQENYSVHVDSFYIDIHEVSNRDYAYFVSATGRKPPVHWKGRSPPEEILDHPVVNVSWEDAVAFAGWSGKRLPTEAEWERAAMGERLRAFPWGESYAPGSANIWSEGHGSTVPAGSSPRDKSLFGLYDMVGNAAEWVDGWLERDRKYRVYRGGSFYVNQDNPSLYSRDGTYPVSRYGFVGFRCARDVSPSR